MEHANFIFRGQKTVINVFCEKHEYKYTQYVNRYLSNKTYH